MKNNADELNGFVYCQHSYYLQFVQQSVETDSLE